MVDSRGMGGLASRCSARHEHGRTLPRSTAEDHDSDPRLLPVFGNRQQRAAAGYKGSAHPRPRPVAHGSRVHANPGRWGEDGDDREPAESYWPGLYLAELQALADFIERNDLILVSDEIHCNIVLAEDSQHLPVAQWIPDIAHRTISLFAATKTYNIPGLGCAAAVIPDDNLRERFQAQEAGLVSGIGPLNLVASEAAFNDRSDWLNLLLQHLRANAARLEAVAGTRMTHVEATYLAWINIADLGLNNIEAHFESHGLGISNGTQFGHPDYIRFNFACPDALLTQGLQRLNQALRV